jgi:hypothetical protein
MRAAVVREFKWPLAIEGRLIPESSDGKILVKTAASVRCHLVGQGSGEPLMKLLTSR